MPSALAASAITVSSVPSDSIRKLHAGGGPADVEPCHLRSERAHEHVPSTSVGAAGSDDVALVLTARQQLRERELVDRG